jgi:ATP-binding cassette subfamily G (WHITE) protein 2 (PDR)
VGLLKAGKAHHAHIFHQGVTGAGKTSLLDILAGRTRIGVITGKICLGNTQHGPEFQGKIGYVQQEDVHLPTTTVREALEFSALLRQPKDKTSLEKLAYVDYIIEVLEMGFYAEAVVGAPGEGELLRPSNLMMELNL